uniref:Uncharacterized protein n=1 Tax=viral metagenome TaxID=1070528 RepID=A0A6C0H7G1_9ZZZZ
MDIDENDMLLTNTFIPTPQLEGEVSQQSNEEFRKYYTTELNQREEAFLRRSLDKMSIRSLHLDESTDANSLLNTNVFTNGGGDPTLTSKGITSKEIKTFVSIDSRDRDIVLYSKPNHFKIFLGKTFYNVKSIRLASVEFPNTNAVINSNNNRIYWRNQEDIDANIIDSVTATYPVYNVSLRVGSYISTTLQTEITSKLGSIKRRNKTGDYHYFTVSLDLDTDIVTVTSLLLTQAGNNPLTVTSGLGLVTVDAASHGFQTGDIVYIVDVKSLAGINSTTLGGAHEITRLNADQFQYEVNIKAGDTARGGGNTVKIGRKAPFQLLFGENPYTIAPNVGFPIENSSKRIDTYIKSIDNIYLVQVRLRSLHNFNNTYNFVSQVCTISGAGTTPSIDGNKVIARIIDNYTILVIVNSKIESDQFSGQVTFGANTFDIVSIINYPVDTVLVSTFTNHNYNYTDIGKVISLYDTISKPDFDGDNNIYGVVSNTQLIIPGNVLPGGNSNVSDYGIGGSIPFHAPLATKVLSITYVITGPITTIVSPNHGLKVGEEVQFDNLFTTPPILVVNSGVFTIASVPDNNSFTIDFSTTSVELSSIDNGTAAVRTKLVTLSFPYHGFNKITSISNNYDAKTITSITNNTDYVNNIYRVVIATNTPHELSNGNIIKITSSNCSPSITGGPYTVTVLSANTIQINLPFDITSNGNSGSLTLNAMRVEVITQLPHGLSSGSTVRLMKTNSVPSIDNGGYVVTVTATDTFTIVYGQGITQAGTSGIIGMNQDFYLYGASSVGGLAADVINGVKYTVRDVIDAHTLNFNARSFAEYVEQGGGESLYISSLLHGFNAIQTNTKNSVLNRSINLQGENYAFLCCPQIATMMNTGKVTNIFARFLLDQSPGSMVFSFLSNPKEFHTAPLNQLSELEFSVVNHDASLYDFNDLDYSFVLEITEIVDMTDGFNLSSRRGITN